MTESDYKLLIKQIQAVLEGETDAIANLGNVSAILMDTLSEINWAGFYLMKEGSLILGPFQGKLACVHIQVGRGVCGTAVGERRTIRVEDVHQFPGHIACDCASNSEIVIPLIREDQVIGVLDIDSPVTARFTELDQQYLEQIGAVVVSACEWEQCGKYDFVIESVQREALNLDRFVKTSERGKIADEYIKELRTNDK